MDDTAPAPIPHDTSDVRERLIWARTCLESTQTNAKREGFSLFAMSDDLRARLVTAIETLYAAARRLDLSCVSIVSSEHVDTISKLVLSYRWIVEALQTTDTDVPLRVTSAIASDLHQAADELDAAMLAAVLEQSPR